MNAQLANLFLKLIAIGPIADEYELGLLTHLREYADREIEILFLRDAPEDEDGALSYPELLLEFASSLERSEEPCRERIRDDTRGLAIP